MESDGGGEWFSKATVNAHFVSATFNLSIRPLPNMWFHPKIYAGSRRDAENHWGNVQSASVLVHLQSNCFGGKKGLNNEWRTAERWIIPQAEWMDETWFHVSMQPRKLMTVLTQKISCLKQLKHITSVHSVQQSVNVARCRSSNKFHIGKSLNLIGNIWFFSFRN